MTLYTEKFNLKNNFFSFNTILDEKNEINEINKFYKFINENLNNLTEYEKKLLIDFSNDLNWNGLLLYYNNTKRNNLINFNFLLWKLILSFKELNQLSCKINFHNDYIYYKNNGLQNMLWEILCPDFIELS